jgi:hypothetical protein
VLATRPRKRLVSYNIIVNCTKTLYLVIVTFPFNCAISLYLLIVNCTKTLVRNGYTLYKPADLFTFLKNDFTNSLFSLVQFRSQSLEFLATIHMVGRVRLLSSPTKAALKQHQLLYAFVHSATVGQNSKQTNTFSASW